MQQKKDALKSVFFSFGWIVGLEPTIEHHHCAISQPIVTEFVIIIFLLYLYT